LEKCNGQIDEIVELVRGRLEAGARITLGALIVIDVHGLSVCLSVCPSVCLSVCRDVLIDSLCFACFAQTVSVIV